MSTFFTPESAMVIVAHPDDIEFSCAGTIARWVQAGSRIAYVLCTSGEVGIADKDMTRENAAKIRQEMEQLGFSIVGGVNSPYIWVHTKRDSWDFFDMLLNEAGVACAPGAGFGSCGEKYVRISTFNSHGNVAIA